MRGSRFHKGVALACLLSVVGIAIATSAHAQSDRPPIFDYVPNVGPPGQSDAELKALNERVRELYQAGRPGEAIPLAEKSLQLTRSQKGQDHPDFGLRLNNLAVLYRDQGRYAEAEPLMQARAGHPREGAGARPPRSRHIAEQPRRAVCEPGPLCRGRAAVQARTGDLREGAGPRPPPCRHLAEQPRRAVCEPGPLRRGRAAVQARLAIREKALGPDHPRCRHLAEQPRLAVS